VSAGGDISSRGGIDGERIDPTVRGDRDGPATKLTVYFGERSRAGGRLLADALLDLHADHRIRASVLLRGVQGFGAKHSQRSDRLLSLSEDLPLVAEAIDAPARVQALLADVRPLAARGLLTLELARLAAPEPAVIQRAAGISESEEGEVKLTVYLGRHQRVGRTPAFIAVCAVLREHGVDGAMVLLGVDGTVAGERRRARFFGRNAGVPLVIVSVGAARPIAAALTALEPVLPEPLIALERARVCKRDGRQLHPPHAPSEAFPGARQKLAIVVSEAAHHQGRSVYLELVRRLRAAGAAGATSLRGIWGFHGEHRPHGDRLLALRRHVPVLTVAIDTPERIAALYPIVDELTRERGLVTSELLPGSTAESGMGAASAG
jgi:PII-like signaling protein